MKSSILSSIAFSFITLFLQSHAAAAVQEITVKNSNEVTLFYNTRNFTTSPYYTPFSGNIDQVGFHRFFQNFTLPEYIPGSTLSSATLNFSYEKLYSNPLQLFGTAGNSASFDWYKQPATTTGVLGLIQKNDAWTSGQIDVTDFINNAYKTGNTAGFLIRSSVEDKNFTDVARFASGQSLNLTFTPSVPEPETYAMLLIGVGLIGVATRRKRA